MDLNTLKKNLIRRGFNTSIFNNQESLKIEVEKIVTDKTVGYGGSLTIKNLGLYNIFESKAIKVFPHLAGEHGRNERFALTADIFFTSANAISQSGEIVNIDGTGNRVAATCFGPRKLVYIISKNKISPNLESAYSKAKAAAVSLAKLYKRNTPCVKTGKCEDCLSSECVCSITTVHRKKPYGIEVDVFLIDEVHGI